MLRAACSLKSCGPLIDAVLSSIHDPKMFISKKRVISVKVVPKKVFSGKTTPVEVDLKKRFYGRKAVDSTESTLVGGQIQLRKIGPLMGKIAPPQTTLQEICKQ